MNKYPAIRNILAALFDSQVGLTNDESSRMYRDSYNRNSNLRQQIAEAFADESLSWMEMLNNEDYEVEEPSTEKEAREIAKYYLLPKNKDQ